MDIIEFAEGNPRIGLVARNGVIGPEQELVDAFTAHIPRNTLLKYLNDG